MSINPSNQNAIIRRCQFGGIEKMYDNDSTYMVFPLNIKSRVTESQALCRLNQTQVNYIRTEFGAASGTRINYPYDLRWSNVTGWMKKSFDKLDRLEKYTEYYIECIPGTEQRLSFEAWNNPYIKEFQTTGVCTIHLNKVIKDWNDTFYLSQWKDEFWLLNPTTKAKISYEDANYLIIQLNLYSTQSPFYNSGKTWYKTS